MLYDPPLICKTTLRSLPKRLEKHYRDIIYRTIPHPAGGPPTINRMDTVLSINKAARRVLRVLILGVSAEGPLLLSSPRSSDQSSVIASQCLHFQLI